MFLVVEVPKEAELFKPSKLSAASAPRVLLPNVLRRIGRRARVGYTVYEGGFDLLGRLVGLDSLALQHSACASS